VFTARYGLSPYIKQTRFFLEGLKPAQSENYSQPEIKKLGSKDESLKQISSIPYARRGLQPATQPFRRFVGDLT
jgi:hypothetical protein